MDTDMILTIGLILAVLAIPAIASAISDSRAPRAAALMVLISGGLITFAVMQKPGGYSLIELPKVVVSVISRFI